MQDLHFFLNPKVNVRSKCQIFVVGQDSERSHRIDPIAGVCRGRSGNVMCANIPEHPSPLPRTAPNKLFDLDTEYLNQGFVKGVEFCFRYLDFYFQPGESTSTASQLTSTASQKSQDFNKVPLLLQNLGNNVFLYFIMIH